MAEAVKSADRVLDVFDLLAQHPEGLTFTELREQLEMPKSSAHALLGTLRHRDFLELDDATRRYTVGMRVWQAGQAYAPLTALEDLARPYMRAVGDELNETVQLAVLDGVHNLYIAKVDSTHQLRLASRVGIRLPAYATGVGKALLGGLSDEAVRQLFAGVVFQPFTSRTVTGMEPLITELRIVRERGYATDDGEYTAGVSCIAVPVRDRSGRVVAAMSVSAPEVRVTSELSRRIVDLLGEQATAMSERLVSSYLVTEQ